MADAHDPGEWWMLVLEFKSRPGNFNFLFHDRDRALAAWRCATGTVSGDDAVLDAALGDDAAARPPRIGGGNQGFVIRDDCGYVYAGDRSNIFSAVVIPKLREMRVRSELVRLEARVKAEFDNVLKSEAERTAASRVRPVNAGALDTLARA